MNGSSTNRRYTNNDVLIFIPNEMVFLIILFGVIKSSILPVTGSKLCVLLDFDPLQNWQELDRFSSELVPLIAIEIICSMGEVW